MSAIARSLWMRVLRPDHSIKLSNTTKLHLLRNTVYQTPRKLNERTTSNRGASVPPDR